MTPEQQTVQQSVEPEAVFDAVDEALSRVKTLLGRVEHEPRNVEFATSFNRAITGLARHRTREVFELLRELSALPVLARARDQIDWPCRAAVLSTWLELGYPFALELSPEDLQYVREHAPGKATGWLNITFVLAVIAAFQNFGAVALALFAVLSSPSIPPSVLLVALPAAAMGAHALALLSRSRQGLMGMAYAESMHRTATVAWGLPVLLGILSLFSVEMGLCLLTWCAPQLLASVTAHVASRTLEKTKR